MNGEFKFGSKVNAFLLSTAGVALFAVCIFFWICLYKTIHLSIDEIIITSVILIGSGLLLLRASRNYIKQNERFTKYAEVILIQKTTSLEKISSDLSINISTVYNDIQKMIDKGYLDAYINLNDSCIVFYNEHDFNLDAKNYKSIKCKNCDSQIP